MTLANSPCETPCIAASEQEPEQGVQSPGRSLLWVITAAFAVGISMLRSCMDG